MINSWRWPPCNLQDALGTALLRGNQAAFHSQLQTIITFNGEHRVACHNFFRPMFLWTVMVVCQSLPLWCEYFWCPVISKLSSQHQLFAFHVLTKRWILNTEEDILTKCVTGLFLKGTYEGYIYSVLAFLLQLVCIVCIWCVVVDL